MNCIALREIGSGTINKQAAVCLDHTYTVHFFTSFRIALLYLIRKERTVSVRCMRHDRHFVCHVTSRHHSSALRQWNGLRRWP